ncbi:MAG TPA: DUF1697 domain-containing protein [Blastocatellia bacterium]|nr:DUF1697 domain-containing protein [Blastocatellia bacterium]
MTRYFAFLRAINVGGHVVKMDRLRQLFESLGFSSVETFIASGNVAFETTSNNVKTLERIIENALREALGYEVATFIRTQAELVTIANYQPFRESDLEGVVSLNIVFLGEALDKKAKQGLMALTTDFDNLHGHGREIYWLCRTRQSESTISNAVLNKTLGMPGTVRGANTVKKMIAKYSRSKE